MALSDWQPSNSQNFNLESNCAFARSKGRHRELAKRLVGHTGKPLPEQNSRLTMVFPFGTFTIVMFCCFVSFMVHRVHLLTTPFEDSSILQIVATLVFDPGKVQRPK